MYLKENLAQETGFLEHEELRGPRGPGGAQSLARVGSHITLSQRDRAGGGWVVVPGALELGSPDGSWGAGGAFMAGDAIRTEATAGDAAGHTEATPTPSLVVVPLARASLWPNLYGSLGHAACKTQQPPPQKQGGRRATGAPESKQVAAQRTNHPRRSV